MLARTLTTSLSIGLSLSSLLFTSCQNSFIPEVHYQWQQREDEKIQQLSQLSVAKLIADLKTPAVSYSRGRSSHIGYSDTQKALIAKGLSAIPALEKVAHNSSDSRSQSLATNCLYSMTENIDNRSPKEQKTAASARRALYRLSARPSLKYQIFDYLSSDPKHSDLPYIVKELKILSRTTQSKESFYKRLKIPSYAEKIDHSHSMFSPFALPVSKEKRLEILRTKLCNTLFKMVKSSGPLEENLTNHGEIEVWTEVAGEREKIGKLKQIYKEDYTQIPAYSYQLDTSLMVTHPTENSSGKTIWKPSWQPNLVSKSTPYNVTFCFVIGEMMNKPYWKRHQHRWLNLGFDGGYPIKRGSDLIIIDSVRMCQLWLDYLTPARIRTIQHNMRKIENLPPPAISVRP